MRKLTIREIQVETAKYFNLDLGVILGKTRRAYPVRARHIAIYLCRHFTENSFSMIGYYFGQRDHTTVTHAYEKVKKNLPNDENLKKEVMDIMVILGCSRGKEKKKNFTPFKNIYFRKVIK